MTKNIFNLSDNNYQFWKEFEYLGSVVNFEHLNASKHTFNHPSRNEKYTIYFTYSHHVFTNKLGDVVYPHSHKDPRFFDHERYVLSKKLPEIIATLPEQFCFHGGYSKYCTCEFTRSDGSTTQYRVVYRTWMQRGKIRFHIESAYPDINIGRVKKVSFWVICHNLLNGKTLPKPFK